MKKHDKSVNKNDTTHDTRKLQKKISSYFTKSPPKGQALRNTDNNTISNEVCKKRKLSSDTESMECKFKVKKCEEVSDKNGIQEFEERSNMNVNVQSISAFNDTKCKDVSVLSKKSVSQKENINTERNKSVLCDKKNKSDSVDHSRLLDKSFNQNINNVQLKTFNKSKEKADFELGTCIVDDFSDCFEEDWSTDTQIDFTCLQRCKVIDVKREYNCTLLTVEQEGITSNATVMCSGFWKDAKVEKDDVVVVQARKEIQCWIVDNNSGFLIIHPDLLISGTTVVGALFCSRKAVLTERFRKMESLPSCMGDQTALVIGSLAHQLLQKAISQNVCELSEITNIMDSLLQSRETIHTLYASEITFDTCREQMLAFVPKIFNFIQHYLKDKKQTEISCQKNNFKGKIVHIHDIEENIWLPKLGIKGKVDVTVEVNINSRRKIMPLEVKTGRPSFSLEHKGQVILYIMMMALTGQDTNTGLLLYLRENIMQEITSGYPERRDLILLRNTLANFFAPKTLGRSSEFISNSDWETMDLPEPINHHSACSKCPYNTLCCAYLTKDTNVKLSESHPLTKISKQILEKFKPTHIDYVVKWVSLLQIEEAAQSPENMVKSMWTLSPEKREAKKTCICNLKVIGNVVEYNSKYQHIFVRANTKDQDTSTNIPCTEFVENEYVVVSTDTRMNLSAGFIMHIKEDSITVLLDRNITRYNIDEFFHIDKYSSSSLYSFNLANVGGLLGHNETYAKLREIIVDRKPATFASGLPKSIVRKSAKILRELNETQQRAILKVVAANEYTLIKGMPGTGKTQTLIALIELLQESGQSVLITAHTNSAVDNILLKLLDKGIDFLRLGSSTLHPLLKHKAEAFATANCHSLDSLEAVYSSKNIVGVTCYGAHHILLGKRMFDVCIIDESAQALQPSVLRPLYSARKFVLVGDPEQLPPIVKSKVARKLGADESLFVRLDSENNTVNLIQQYRMNRNIMRLANKLTYNDVLVAGNVSVENATFSAMRSENLEKQEKWIQKTLSRDINDSVIILNTGSTTNLKGDENINKYPKTDQIHSNIWEAAVISKLLQALLEMDVKLENVGIIAPYRAHVNLLRKVVHKNVEVNTVDQYQGRDKEIILYSCAKSLTNSSNIKEDLEILGDHRRLTVAITRAKHKLIIIADKCTVSKYLPFRKLFSFIDDKSVIDLSNCNDFSWESILYHL